MIEIQNSKIAQDFKNDPSKAVSVIEYCTLIFVCNLLARRISGGVLVYWFF